MKAYGGPYNIAPYHEGSPQTHFSFIVVFLSMVTRNHSAITGKIETWKGESFKIEHKPAEYYEKLWRQAEP